MSSLSDSDLIARLPGLVHAERGAMADVIEHLVEVERRQLYLRQACSCLHRYCIDRLGYSEDAALKRHRVARLALCFPEVLEELRAGTIHLTGLFLLSRHLTEDNAGALLSEARGKSRRQIEELIARWFPRPDVESSIEPVASSIEPVITRAEPGRTEQLGLPEPQLGNAATPGGALHAAARRGTCPEAGRPGSSGGPGRLEPLSASSYRVEFTARAELRDKVDRARELLSHALPGGELGELFEHALDALIERETRKRLGAGRPRKRRKLKEGSRHVPVEIARGRLGTRRGPVHGRGPRRAALQRAALSDARAPPAVRFRWATDTRKPLSLVRQPQCREGTRGVRRTAHRGQDPSQRTFSARSGGRPHGTRPHRTRPHRTRPHWA